MNRQSRGSFFIGGLLIIIGSLLMLQKFSDIHLGRSYILPIVLILAGTILLLSIKSRERSGAAMPGTFFLASGAILLSMNYGPIYNVLSNIYPWTMIFLVISVSFFVLFAIKPRDVGLLVPSSVFLILGVLFLLHDFWIIDWGHLGHLWPFIPIAIGVTIVIRALLKQSAPKPS